VGPALRRPPLSAYARACSHGSCAHTFRASRFDRSPGARIYTLNLLDELTRHAGAATDLRRLCDLVTDGRLDGGAAAEFSWREYAAAFDALLRRRAGGKIVLRADRAPQRSSTVTAATSPGASFSAVRTARLTGST